MKHTFFSHSILCALLLNTHFASAMENDNDNKQIEQVSLNSIHIPKQKESSLSLSEENFTSRSRSSSTNSLSKKSYSSEQKKNHIETFYTYWQPFYKSSRNEGFYQVGPYGEIDTFECLKNKHMENYRKIYKGYITDCPKGDLSVLTTHIVTDHYEDKTIFLNDKNQFFFTFKTNN